jgi:hypothetical protein
MATALWNFILSQPASPKTTLTGSFFPQEAINVNAKTDVNIIATILFIFPPFLFGAFHTSPVQRPAQLKCRKTKKEPPPDDVQSLIPSISIDNHNEKQVSCQ